MAASRELCNCELRNRQWNPNTGKCGTCGLAFPIPLVSETGSTIRDVGEARELTSAKRVGDRYTTRVVFARAEDTTPDARELVQEAVITIADAPPKFETLEHARQFYGQQARGLCDALARSLPGGTFDALLGEMLSRKASLFRVLGPEGESK